MWGVPNISGPILGVPIIRIVVHGATIWGPQIVAAESARQVIFAPRAGLRIDADLAAARPGGSCRPVRGLWVAESKLRKSRNHFIYCTSALRSFKLSFLTAAQVLGRYGRSLVEGAHLSRKTGQLAQKAMIRTDCIIHRRKRVLQIYNQHIDMQPGYLWHKPHLHLPSIGIVWAASSVRDRCLRALASFPRASHSQACRSPKAPPP